LPLQGRIKLAVLGSLAVLSLTMALSATSAGADTYEPNDSLLESAGPLANHQTYSAELDAENDKDFFYFYVTSPASPVTLNVNNLGGDRSSHTLASRF
jgi:hypothetical protein